MSTLPVALAAPEPGWTVDTDVVVVGSGIAGLTTALHLSLQSSLRVLLVTKYVLAAGSTRWAQGGIAAALGAGLADLAPREVVAKAILRRMRENGIRDTRKTMPGLRLLEKYAVRCGGGVNHRMSLSDAALVKDNHVVAAGGVVAAFRAVRDRYPDLPLEIEVDTVEQAREVIDAGADLVLLDNMAPGLMRQVVEFTQGRAKLEASGRSSLDDAYEVAATGVDHLAVGALTHSAPVLDIGLDL